MTVLASPRVEVAKTSASQVEAFLRCHRYWFNKSVLKLPEPFSAPAQKGTRVHKISEYWLKSGLLSQPPGTTDEDMEIAQVAITHMPKRGPELLIEHEFELPTYPGGPIWLGYIDLVDPRQDPIQVLDHKTRSDFRYCLKPNDLLKSVQMTSYAKWAMDHFKRDEVLVGHKYVCTKRTKTPPHYKTLLVTAIANRKQVEAVWAELMPVVAAMMEWRKLAPATADDLEPNTASCGAYGGCAFKPQCGFGPSPNKTFSIRKAPTMSDTTQTPPPANANGSAAPMSLSQKLAAKKAAALAAAAAGGAASSAAAPAPAPVKAAPPAGAPAVGLVPPDAPENAAAGAAPEEKSVAAPAEEKKAKKKSAARSAVLDAANEPESGTLPGVSTTPPVAAPKPETKTEEKSPELAAEEAAALGAPFDSGPTGAGPSQLHEKAPPTPAIAIGKKRLLAIYVDCMPVKGAEGEHALFEDWAAPLIQQIADDAGIADYRLMQFAGWKPHLANAIRQNVDTLPPVLVMSSYGPGVQEALDALTPYATKIVKKLG